MTSRRSPTRPRRGRRHGQLVGTRAPAGLLVARRHDALRRGRPHAGDGRGARARVRRSVVHRPGRDAGEGASRPRRDDVAQRGALRADARAHRGRRGAVRGEAARVRPRRGRPAAARGGTARPLLRHQLQPPLRQAGAARARCGARRSDRRRRLRDLALRRRGRHERAPVRQPDRDPVSRLRHARAPVRTDREPCRPSSRT